MKKILLLRKLVNFLNTLATIPKNLENMIIKDKMDKTDMGGEIIEILIEINKKMIFIIEKTTIKKTIIEKTTIEKIIMYFKEVL